MATQHARHRRVPDDKSAMQAAFLAALKQRVARDPTGEVVLPVGKADMREVKRVLAALARVTSGGR
jgi:hypothetical protein